MAVQAHPMPFNQAEYDRTIIERFQTDGPENWHFVTTVFQATNQEEAEWITNLDDGMLSAWKEGDLNLVKLKVEAYVDPVWLGTAVSALLTIDGLTFTGGKMFGANVRMLDSWEFSRVCERAKYDGLEQLAKLNRLLGVSVQDL